VAVIAWEQVADLGAKGSLELYRTATALAAGDSTTALKVPGLNDKTVQVFGSTIGTITIEGTLEPTAVNWFGMNDSRGEGNPLVFTIADGRTALENVVNLRAVASGLAAGVTVYVLCARAT
jgi:hypothetical protein